MDWKVSTAPSIEPVTLAEAKLHLRVDSTSDNDLITELISTTRQWCEGYQNRAYIEQSITAKLDSFSDIMSLPMPPLISVTSIKYYDTNGDQQTLSSSYYDVDTTSEPGLITLAYNQTWPTVRGIHHAIEIIYKAGYGDEASDVPEHIKSVIKLLVGHFYEHREGVSEFKFENIPFGIKSLLSINRIVSI